MCLRYSNSFVVVVQSLNHVWLCTSMDCSTPGLLIPHCLSEFAQTHVHQASDAIQPAYSLSPSSPFAFNLFQHQVFPMNWLFTSGGQSIGALASSSVLPMNIQGWFLWELAGLISLLSNRLSRVFSSTTVQNHQFFGSQPPTLTSIHDYWKNRSIDYMDLCWQSDVSAFNMLSRFVIAFLPRSKCLFISWLWSPSAVILEPKKIKSASASIFSPSICHEVMGPDAVIFIFSMLSFKSAFSLSSFTFTKRLFSSS